ncbi:ATP-binding protein [Sulfuritalea sp.]|uniref:PAS domain-containing hybrid sensor histidine kinase/response regulator n=1 Tax=Sulfuritalea sp. TaxID=2480090 RepID=UPI00286E2E2C|nr:ATP-binding protein [Sulfuritalea sp.]
MTGKDPATLREAAEARLQAATTSGAAGAAPAARADADLLRLVHELQVHKIELEMQNSELRESRAEREAALARYTELYDFAPVGYLALTYDGLIAEVNLTGATLLGVARRDLLLKRFAAFVVPGDRERWAGFLANVKTQDGKRNMELALQRADGTEFYALMDCIRHRVGADNAANPAVIPSVGNPLEVIIALTDISVRKGIEARLQEAMAAAEKANRAKTDFLSSMSHELRTPLNAILGFAQLMESSAPPPTAGQQRDLGRILKAGWYLLELINEILDLALIESGKAMLSQESVSLVDVMLECRAMVEPQAQQRGITMAFTLRDSAWFVDADRTRLKQVLINLLFNAIKYNRPDGTVTVECRPASTDTLRIGIRDSGEGLTADQLGQLFQPFNRLGKEAGAEEGTGIGLVVTKRLVELMGGSIGVNSSVGVGSEFWVELRLASAPAFAPADAAASTPELAQRALAGTLLYVEDNPANLELVEQLVARRPELRLLSAADGKLGMEFALAYQPQVIVMDINLPDISGLDVMKSLRADPSTAHIPIIALSANALPGDIAYALQAGFYRYLTKPIKIEEFMDALDTAFKFAATRAASDARRA